MIPSLERCDDLVADHSLTIIDRAVDIIAKENSLFRVQYSSGCKEPFAHSICSLDKVAEVSHYQLMPTDIPPPLSRPFEEMRLKYTGLTVDGIDVAMLYVDDDWVLPLVVTFDIYNAIPTIQ